MGFRRVHRPGQQVGARALTYAPHVQHLPHTPTCMADHHDVVPQAVQEAGHGDSGVLSAEHVEQPAGHAVLHPRLYAGTRGPTLVKSLGGEGGGEGGKR